MFYPFLKWKREREREGEGRESRGIMVEQNTFEKLREYSGNPA